MFDKAGTSLVACPNGKQGDVVLPAGVTSIGNAAFQGCAGLTRITLPAGVTNIGDDAFQDCGGLTRILLPESVRSIGNQAFDACASLTSLTVPSGVRVMGSAAFGPFPLAGGGMRAGDQRRGIRLGPLRGGPTLMRTATSRLTTWRDAATSGQRNWPRSPMARPTMRRRRA